MNLAQQTLLNLLVTSNTDPTHQKFYLLKEKDPGYLTTVEMADLYITSALLITIMGFLKEQLWLSDKKDISDNTTTSYEHFLTPFFKNELSDIVFLKDFLLKSGKLKIKQITKDSQYIELKVLALVGKRSSGDQKSFINHSLKEMSKKFIAEENDQKGEDQSLGHKGLELYRTFDHLDKLFGLNYQLDKDMEIDQTVTERLYEGAGVGVQSGYSTILLALDSLDPQVDSTIIDLGSGYGRVGLVCSILRPDINFTGYEYVAHRVDISNNASKSLGLEGRLHFITQDLSLESFKIPDADIFYLYDPFTVETYQYVLSQLVALSEIKRISIVTKGNARSWLSDIAIKHGWESPIAIDEGNLCIFITPLISSGPI